MTRAWLGRWALMYGVWLVLAGLTPWDAVVGVPAAAAAAWASVVVLPPSGRRLVMGRVVVFVVKFLWQSVVAGVDVAQRVFRVSMPLRPGVVRVAPRFPAGTERMIFCGLASLQPGSLPCGLDEEGNVLFHCLDTRDDLVGALMRTQDDLAQCWEGGAE